MVTGMACEITLPEMEHVRWTSEPRLRDPVLVCGFAGWNDAGEAATMAIRHLAATCDARPFASIDAEEYFDFSQVRPHVRLADGVTREIVWPHGELLAAPLAGARRDLVLLLGIEPQLRWRTYARQVTEVAQRLGAQLVITLGALLADVPHSRDVAIMGTAADPDLIEKFDLTRSRYEGPTGIVGVLHDAFATAGFRSLSLWAGVPTYTQQHPSPKAALALVERAASILEVTLPVGALRASAAEYEQTISDMVADDDDLSAFVTRLEELADSGELVIDDDDDDDDEDDEDSDERDGTVNHAEDDHEAFVAEVEQFLRDQNKGG
jgi:predicted ATP-grasp superfamily ATP-dependent carboligase